MLLLDRAGIGQCCRGIACDQSREGKGWNHSDGGITVVNLGNAVLVIVGVSRGGCACSLVTVLLVASARNP